MVATHGFSPRLLFTGLGLTMMLFVSFAAPMLVVYWTVKLWGRFTETHLGALVGTVISGALMVVIGAAVLDSFRAALQPAVIVFSTGDWFVKDVAPWLGVAVVVWIVGAFLAGICMPIIEQITDAGAPQAAPETQQEEADDCDGLPGG